MCRCFESLKRLLIKQFDIRQGTTYDAYFEDLKQLLMQKCYIRSSDFKVCTPEEIEAVMAAQGVKRLPQMFRRYLELMGNAGMNSIYTGSDWRCREMHSLKKA